MYTNLDYVDLLGMEYGTIVDGKPIRCYNLCQILYKRLGKNLPDFDTEGTASVLNQILDEGKQWFKELEQPEPFCLVTFCIISPYVSHVGIVLEDGKHFIHIMPRLRVAIEKMTDPAWKHRVRGFYKWPE